MSPDFELSITSTDLIDEWSRCNQLANYLAGFLASGYSSSRELAENLLSSALNEVFESLSLSTLPDSEVRLAVRQQDGRLWFEFCHQSRTSHRVAYEEFLAGLAGALPESEFLHLLLEEEELEPKFNRLGLALLVHDFGVRFRVAPDSDCTMTTISLPAEDFRP